MTERPGEYWDCREAAWVRHPATATAAAAAPAPPADVPEQRPATVTVVEGEPEADVRSV